MFPNFLKAASLPLAAAWPLFGLDVIGGARFSHRVLVFPLSNDRQIFHLCMKASRSSSASARISGVSRGRPSVVASGTLRSPQTANMMAKDDQVDHSHAFPQMTANGKTFYDLEGCSTFLLPPLPPKNSQYFVFNLQKFLKTLDLSGRSIWRPDGAGCIDSLKDDGIPPSSSLMPFR